MKVIVILLLVSTVHSFLYVPTIEGLKQFTNIKFEKEPKKQTETTESKETNETKTSDETKYGTHSRPLSFYNVVYEGLVSYLSKEKSFRGGRTKPVICVYARAIPGILTFLKYTFEYRRGILPFYVYLVYDGEKLTMKTIAYAESQSKKMKEMKERAILEESSKLATGPMGFLPAGFKAYSDDSDDQKAIKFKIFKSLLVQRLQNSIKKSKANRAQKSWKIPSKF